MSRHFWWACDREGGFTFVELLVTIIIAGLAFAAMVPVFVGAQQVSSGEVMRNTAVQLAQDKLEKVRALDYDSIVQDDLTDNTVPNGDFGTSTTWSTGGGGTRTFTVSYQVDLIDANGQAGAANGTEKYKQVTITTSWDAPPQPVRPVVLSTMISKQYAGPQIVRFNIGPSTVIGTSGGVMEIQSGPVGLDAYIAAEDIESMNRSESDEDLRGFVQFSVTPVNGTAVASQRVALPVSDTDPGHYHFQWDNSAAPDGTYIFQVYAVAGFGSRTQGVPWSYAFQYTNHSPSPPTSLTTQAGDGTVILSWVAATVGDLDHYDVWRSTDNVTFVHLGDAATSTSYTDSGLTNGTTYYYKVRTVDTEGFSGSFTSVVSATPIVTGDTTPPADPAPFTATPDSVLPTVHLAWTASADVGSPASGLAGYIVERSTDNATWAPLQTLYEGITYDDTTTTWSTQYYYRVRAIDLACNQSGNALAGPITTATAVPRNIAVTNNSSQQSYVWVLNTGTNEWYTSTGVASASCPAGQWVKKNGNTVTWTGVPSGLYQVYFMSTSTFDENNPLKLVAVNANAGNGVATYP